MAKKNPYEILDVDQDASQESIKEAYRNKAKENHPDKGGKPEEMALIIAAYEKIGTEEKRKRYDEKGYVEDEDPKEKEFLQYATSTLIALAEQCPDVTRYNLIEDFKKMTQNKMAEMHNNIRDCHKRVDLYNKVLKRLSRNNGLPSKLIEGLTMHKETFEKDIEYAKERIEFYVYCNKMIGDYMYKIDEEELSDAAKMMLTGRSFGFISGPGYNV